MGELRRLCQDNMLSFLRIREWAEVHRQLEDVAQELRLSAPKGARKAPANAADLELRLHRALLTGLLSKIGQWNPEQRVYIGAKQTRFMLHPSSALAKKPPAWVMAFELVETSQLFARTAAKLDPEWLDEVGAHLLKRSYSDPHWSEKSARSSIKENTTLFGLPVFRGRSVDYATVSPGRARLMFLEHALVRGEYRTQGRLPESTIASCSRRSRAIATKRAKAICSPTTKRCFRSSNSACPNTWSTARPSKLGARPPRPRIRDLLRLRLEDVLTFEQGLLPQHYPDAIEIARRADPGQLSLRSQRRR